MAIDISRFQRWAKRLVGTTNAPERTEITIETEQLVIIRRQVSTRGWCQRCGCEVDLAVASDVKVTTVEGQQGLVQHGDDGGGWQVADAGEKREIVGLDPLRKSQS